MTKEVRIFVAGCNLFNLLKKIENLPASMIPKKGIIWIYN